MKKFEKKMNVTVRVEAMQAAMLSARMVDIPAFVEAMKLVRAEKPELARSFFKAYITYENKWAVFEASTCTEAKEAVERCFSKLLGINQYYRDATANQGNGNEGDRIFKKFAKSLRDKENALEDIRVFYNEYAVRSALYD